MLEAWLQGGGLCGSTVSVCWGPSALSRAEKLCAGQPTYRRVAGKLVKAVVLLPVRSTGPIRKQRQEQRSPGSVLQLLVLLTVT
jgi:hypothetical protein